MLNLKLLYSLMSLSIGIILVVSCEKTKCPESKTFNNSFTPYEKQHLLFNGTESVSFYRRSTNDTVTFNGHGITYQNESVYRDNHFRGECKLDLDINEYSISSYFHSQSQDTFYQIKHYKKHTIANIPNTTDKVEDSNFYQLSFMGAEFILHDDLKGAYIFPTYTFIKTTYDSVYSFSSYYNVGVGKQGDLFFDKKGNMLMIRVSTNANSFEEWYVVH